MKRFLSPNRQKKLLETLIGLGVHVKIANEFVSVPDDMHEVDLVMKAHVLSVALCRKLNKMDEACKGLACLATIMAEGIDRGLGEDDFPMSLKAIKDDLRGRGMVQ